jgi:hypothetical protein
MNENSLSRWKSAFLTLQDTAFFDIVRNYLGEIKTPYNKHVLLGNLETFLRSHETRRRMISLLDRRDSRLLTAIHILEAPTHDRIHRFFEGEIGYLDLHHHLMNLQDRLLIYADRSTGDEEILITPLLEEDLLIHVIDPRLLIPSQNARIAAPPEPWLNDSLLTAMLSYLLEKKDIFKSDGTIRKKAEAELREKFPVLFGGSISRRSELKEDNSRINLLFSAFLTTGLLRNTESGIEPDLDSWREFAGLPLPERSCLIMRGSRQKDLFQSWREAEWLMGFISILKITDAYSLPALVRLGRLAANRGPAGVLIQEDWILGLIDFDVLVSNGGDEYSLNPLFPLNPADHPKETCIIIQPNFDIAAKPHLTLPEGIPLAATANIKKYDRFPHYELTKTAFSRALALGYEGKNLRKHLALLNGEALPQNISFSLEEWEREFSGFAMVEGVVILVDEDRRHLFDHHREFRTLFKLNPAPGVYLVDRSSLTQFHKALQNAGIEIMPRLRKAEELPFLETATPPALFDPDLPNPPESRIPRIFFPRSFTPVSPKMPVFTLRDETTPSLDFAEENSPDWKLQEELYRLLSLSDLPEDQIQEIRERIRRRIILFPEQIRPDTARKEKMEAKGLNYVGKVLIIEQTIQSTSDYLEIVSRAPDGSPSRILARPKELRRTGSDLILTAHTIPENTVIDIPVKKIGLLRRLRGFLMG